MGNKNKIKRYLHLRDLPSIVFKDNVSIPPKFALFVDEIIMPILKLSGYKLKLKQEIAEQCLFALVKSGLVDKTIADSRNHKHIGRNRIAVWDSIVSAKLATKCTGSEGSKKVTRYYATSSLLSKYDNWPPDLLKEIPFEPGLIRLSKGCLLAKNGIPIDIWGVYNISDIRTWYEKAWGKNNPDININDNSYWEAVENILERINSNNLQHTWQAFKRVEGNNGKTRLISFQPNVCYCQIHSKEPFRAARLYTWGYLGGQSLSVDQRQSMLIDGEKVTELDYKGHQLRMLYHSNRLECKKDPYIPEVICLKVRKFPELQKELRRIIKKITLLCINCNSFSQAVGAANDLLDECTNEMKDFIYKVEKSNARDLLKRIENKHSGVASDFYMSKGTELMTWDGYIIKDVLREFVTAEKPALAIHDSLVVKISDALFAKKIMNYVYARYFPNRKAVIEKTF
jgi:hypothetical protein